jgi:hypothetical protein
MPNIAYTFKSVYPTSVAVNELVIKQSVTESNLLFHAKKGGKIVRSHHQANYMTTEDLANHMDMDMDIPDNHVKYSGRFCRTKYPAGAGPDYTLSPHTVDESVIILGGTTLAPQEDWGYFAHVASNKDPVKIAKAYEIFAKAGRGVQGLDVYDRHTAIDNTDPVTVRGSTVLYGQGFFIPEFITDASAVGTVLNVDGVAQRLSTLIRTEVAGTTLSYSLWIKAISGSVSIPARLRNAGPSVQYRDVDNTTNWPGITQELILPENGWVHISSWDAHKEGTNKPIRIHAEQNSRYAIAIPYITNGKKLLRPWQLGCPVTNQDSI